MKVAGLVIGCLGGAMALLLPLGALPIHLIGLGCLFILFGLGRE